MPRQRDRHAAGVQRVSPGYPAWVEWSGVNDKELHHPDASSDEPFSLRVRIVQYIFVFLGVILTLALAWWQWTTWQSSGGTFQNLGYAIQWPIFGGFLVFGYRKYIQYERERLLGDDQAAVSKKLRTEMTEIPDDFLADVNKSDHTAADVSRSDVDDDRRRRARHASTEDTPPESGPESAPEPTPKPKPESNTTPDSGTKDNN